MGIKLLEPMVVKVFCQEFLGGIDFTLPTMFGLKVGGKEYAVERKK